MSDAATRAAHLSRAAKQRKLAAYISAPAVFRERAAELARNYEAAAAKLSQLPLPIPDRAA